MPRITQQYSILVVNPSEEQVEQLFAILAGSKLRSVRAQSCRDALDYLRSHPVPVVLCESELPDGNWRTLLRDAADLAAPPNLVVTSRLADDWLWSEVLNLGGYDVLPAPFEATEVSRVTELAAGAWHRSKSDRRKHAGSVRTASGENNRTA